MAGRPWHTDNRGAADDGGDARWIGAGYGLGGGPRQLDRAAPALIEHWNGTAWKRVPSPTPDTPKNLPMGPKVLTSVAATSATNAWAVGYYFNGAANQALALHWR